jgi:hypothetical protein
MTSRPIVVLGGIAALVRLYPKTCAAVAFELGVLASSLLKAMRRRRASNGAKVIEVVPSIPRASARRKRKPAARKARARKPATTPAQSEAA